MVQLAYSSSLFLIIVAQLHTTRAGVHEKNLVADLFDADRYNVLERPVKNDNESLTVTISFNLQQVIQLDLKEQYLQSSFWIEQSWHDSKIVWDPAQYGGLKKIRLPSDKVWKPDFLMYNSASEKFDSTWPVNVVLVHTGSVNYIPPALLKSTCNVNVKWFPFDEQFCVLKFGSWTYDDKQVNLSLGSPPLDTSDYVPNGELDLIDTKAKIFYDEFHYAEGVVEIYPNVKICLRLERWPLYYYLNLMVPAVLTLLISVVVFILPTNSDEKMSLSITIVLSLTVFTMVVADCTPRTSDAIPLIGIYFTGIMLICSASVFVSLWVVNLHHFPNLNNHPPTWIRNGISVKLAGFLRMSVALSGVKRDSVSADNLSAAQLEAHFRTKQFTLSDAMIESSEFNTCDQVGKELAFLLKQTMNEGDKRDGSLRRPLTMENFDDPANDNDHHASANGTLIQERNEQLGRTATDEELLQFSIIQIRLVLKGLKILTRAARQTEKKDLIATEWKIAAAVVDRVCLYTFGVTNFICVFFIMLWKPPIANEGTSDWPCPQS